VAQAVELILQRLVDLGGRVDINRQAVAQVGHFIEEFFVPVGADAHHGHGDVALAGGAGNSQAAFFVAVGVAIGEEDEVGAPVLGAPSAGFSKSLLQALKQFRSPLRPKVQQGRPGRPLVQILLAGQDRLGVVIEGDQGQPIIGIQMIDEVEYTLLDLLQAAAFHRGATIDHENQIQRKSMVLQVAGGRNLGQDVQYLRLVRAGHPLLAGRDP